MATEILIPQAGESVTSGVVLRWVRSVGDYVKRDETILEIETDKATMEVPAPVAGVIKAQKVKEGDTVKIGASVGSIDEKATAPAGAAAAPAAKARVESAASTSEPKSSAPVAVVEARSTPLARKTAEQLKVDLGALHGTGPGGRIREADVVGAAGKPSTNGHAEASPAARAPQGPRAVSREKMTPIRMRIAQRLVQAQHTAAMLTTFNECDLTGVLELRKQYKEEFEKKHAVGLGFMSFFVKAVVGALEAFPLVNSYIVDDHGAPSIEKHGYCDVAVAVGTPKGLVVPVVRNCETLSFAQIEQAIKDLATRAKDGKLSLEEMQGGTFTITNGGIYGSLMSTPILNPPQSAILGMHAIKSRAVEYPVGSGQVAIRPMMYLALSYDHRIIDGAEAVQFLVKIKQAIEDPQRLMLKL